MKMLTSKGADPGDEEELGDGVAFAGYAPLPSNDAITHNAMEDS